MGANDLEQTLLVLRQGIDLNARASSWAGDWPLHTAIKNSSLAICEALLDAGAKADQVSDSGARALHRAVWAPAEAIGKVRLLLARGACPNACDTFDIPPLRVAINHRRGEEATQALLDHGADPNAPLANGSNKGALAIAADLDKMEAAKSLIKAGANIEAAMADRAESVDVGDSPTWKWVSAMSERAKLKNSVEAASAACVRPRKNSL